MSNIESSHVQPRTISSADFASIKRDRAMQEYQEHRHRFLSAALFGARSILGNRDGRDKQIAQDALQTLMEDIWRNPDRIPDDVESMSAYMYTMAKNKAADIARHLDPRRHEVPFGGLRDLDTGNFRHAQRTGGVVGRYPGKRSAISPQENTNDAERRDAERLLRAFYDFALREGEYAGSRFERSPNIKPEHFERMLHVLRYFVHGLSAEEIAQRLVDTGLMQPYDQQDRKACKRAEDLVYQTKHRAEERLRAMVDKWPIDQIDALHDAYRDVDESAS